MTLSKLSSEELLKMKLKDLRIDLNKSYMKKRVDALYNELEMKGLVFKPHIWISDEWFTPDDIAGFAVPFYLTHPRLVKLEKEQMFEAEGAEKKECMRIMRHESGHAISHAYQLYFRKDWKKTFGDFRKPYPLWYVPDISSKEYVTHLNAWYAQAHPLEDFAETFAVWLNPASDWMKTYKNWPAINKLKYVEKLIGEIRLEPPQISGNTEYAALSKIRVTLQDHYTKKKNFYSADWAESFDLELKKIFKQGNRKNQISAAEFIRKKRKSLRRNISTILDIPQYTVDQIIGQMIRRTEQIGLVLRTEKETESKLLIVLTSQLINTIQTGYHRIPL